MDERERERVFAPLQANPGGMSTRHLSRGIRTFPLSTARDPAFPTSLMEHRFSAARRICSKTYNPDGFYILFLYAYAFRILIARIYLFATFPLVVKFKWR